MASSAGDDRSAVKEAGRSASPCGYCKQCPPGTAVSYGLVASSLSVQDYQDLLDRGWRRSGTYLYKPDLERSCCPPYTIRLKASAFVASKDQMRVLRRMQRFLEEGYRGPKEVGENTTSEPATARSISDDDCYLLASGGCSSSHAQVAMHSGNKTVPKELETSIFGEEAVMAICELIRSAVSACFGSGVLDAGTPTVVLRPVSASLKDRLKAVTVNAHLVVLYTSNIAFAVSARLKRKGMLQETGVAEQTGCSDLSPVDIAEVVAAQMQASSRLHGLSVQAINGHLNFLGTPDCKTAGTVAGNTSLESAKNTWKSGSDRTPGQLMPPKPRSEHSLEITMTSPTFDAEEFELYKKYQTVVHDGKNISEKSYRRFLIESPLIPVLPTGSGSIPSCGFGSFHQHYRIDGQLVAVGVVDILPRCLSSKYSFYDPDFAFLSLGKFTALQEIKWVQQAQKECATLEYYYMGFYMHSCQKMRYKADYKPSELLCPVQYSWVPYAVARPLIDKFSVACLSAGETGRTGEATPRESEVDVETKALNETMQNIPLLVHNTYVQIKDSKYLSENFKEEYESLRDYIDHVGHTVARRMVLLV